jgi:hypothetical protein
VSEGREGIEKGTSRPRPPEGTRGIIEIKVRKAEPLCLRVAHLLTKHPNESVPPRWIGPSSLAV